MEYKRNTIVIFNGIAQAAFIKVEMVYKDIGAPCILTSGMDGTHSEGSLHYRGLAWDFRIWNVKDVPDLVKRLKKALDPMYYDVVLEGDHIHLEYDPKQRRGL